jgi:PAS domain S-box-containing protein
MSASAAQFQFAAEFVTFLVAAAGVALVLLRGELLARVPGGRALLGLGFTALGASAFLHGSRVVEDSDDPVVLALRAGGVVGITLGSLAWSAGATARLFLWGGLAVTVGAVAVDAVASGDLPRVLLIAGAAGLGTATLLASRRAIAARVAAGAAGALLLVVLVLSVALSAVLANTVEDQELTRLDARARSEATFAERETTARLGEARIVAANLARERGATLQALAAGGAGSVNGELATLSSTYLLGTPLAFVAPDGKVLGVTGLDPATAVALAGSEVVREALQTVLPAGSVEVVAGRGLAVAASPARVQTPGSNPVLLGVAVAVSGLDDDYLNVRSSDDEALSLALADRTRVLATFGRQADASAVLSLARSVIDTGRGASTTTPARFVAVRPVRAADERPVLAMVASTPTTIVGDSRDSLFRTLFVIALGGTLLALLIAGIVGERIGAGLRRLTRAAEGIRRGDFDVRTAVVGDDEVGVLSAAFDSMAGSIQEKTETETRLRNRLEAVVAGMGEALVAVDDQGRITDFNQAAEELLGVHAGEVRGQPADAVIGLSADDGTDLGARLRKPMPGRWSTEAWVEDSNATRIPVSVLGGPLRGPAGESAGAVFVLRDLRPEREVERMKTEFLSRIGHELRTPLTGIMGYAELLTRKSVPADRARQWHEEILKQSKALHRIVQMLEFFASSSANRVMLRPEVLDVRSVVDEVVQRWGARVDGDHRITRRVSRGVPKVTADRRWLTLSLDELVDNAVKFSPNGGNISVVASPSDKGVELAVIDRGKGMSPQEQELAFADFVQGDTSDTRRFGGLGLGLSLVQRVAEAHGGTVSVLSELGKGSRFSIFLPAAPIQKKR